MNQTTEGSKQLQIVNGGQTIPLEDGKIEMPPECAKTTDKVLENILNGEFQEIKMGNCKAEDILSKAQLKELNANREERKTVKALARREKETQR